MMKFFDYVYYKSCQFYYANGEGDGAGISGLAFLSLIQYLNLISIIAILWLIFPYKFVFTGGAKVITALIFIIIVVVNGFRYNKMNYNTLRERWDNEDKKIKRKKEIRVIFYILITVIIVIGLIFRKSIFN
jgi:hypothetical protein